jgi:hypothetical protein
MSNPEIVEVQANTCAGCSVCAACAICAITVPAAVAVGVDGVASALTLWE